MKTLRNFILVVLFNLAAATVFAQTKSSAESLIKEGIAFHDSGKYDDAIAKYKEALKLEPDNASANYELSYSLYSSGKGKEAIPYLEKVIQLNSMGGQPYDMLGNIYDDSDDGSKALEYYDKGIKLEPDYQRLHYNRALSLFRQNRLTEAEASAITAIKLQPKHASSQRIYALIANKQGQLGRSLMGWCSFLLIEPQTKRSAEAMAYVKAIVNRGVKRTGDKAVTITVNSGDMSSANLLMPMTVASAVTDKVNLTATDSLALQLGALFKIGHTITGDKDQPFVASYYSDFFQKLAQSGNMPAFVHYISLSVYPEENKKWFADHDAELTAFDKWVSASNREF